jgi:biotin carboxylase
VESDSRSGSLRLLVLGAGPAQLGLLEAARARGLWVAVADRDPGAPGFTFADRRCILSTEDEPAIERLVGALGIEGIIAPGTDWPVGVAARIAEHAGLPHPISAQTAVLATNKLRQRERLAAAGVPQPRSWVIGGEDDPPEISGPVVVKAPDRQGQKGLTLVESPQELGAAIELARSAARNGLALVEELVDGPEVTVVGFSVDGVFTALTVTDRITAAPPAFGVALAHVWPSHVRGLTPDVAERAVAALGIANGPSYTQLRIGREGPMVIEVAARLGGGHDAELVEAAVGVDLNGLALAAALGEPLAVPEPAARAGGAVTRFLVASPGLLERVEVPGDVQARIYREPGFVITPLRRGSDRAGAVLVTGRSR